MHAGLGVPARSAHGLRAAAMPERRLSLSRATRAWLLPGLGLVPGEVSSGARSALSLQTVPQDFLTADLSPRLPRSPARGERVALRTARQRRGPAPVAALAEDERARRPGEGAEARSDRSRTAPQPQSTPATRSNLRTRRGGD